MPSEFRLKREVQFYETDMAGIMHFANFFYYMEEVEHAFFRSLGFTFAKDKMFPNIGWPRVHVACTYSRPLKFEDQVEIHLIVREKKNRSLRYDIVFTRVAADQHVEVARGTMTVVCVAQDAQGQLKATVIPEEIARRIDAVPVPGGDSVHSEND